jgi:hypothetical protein
MIAIRTKYLGPTDTLGSRVKAFTSNGQQRTIPWGQAARDGDNHKIAAMALCVQEDWKGHMVGAHVRNGMVWVWTDTVAEFTL